MKKLGFIILAVVVALGAIGAGYAAWSQTLTVSATVGTGNLAASYTNVTPATNGPDAGGASITATGGSSLVVTITDGYPGYSKTVNFDISNTGTIPISLAGTTLPSGIPAWLNATFTPPTGTLGVGAHAGTLVLSIPSTSDNTSMSQSYVLTIPVVANQVP